MKKPVEGLAATIAVTELREIGLDKLADALEFEFLALRAQRDAARDTAAVYEAELHHLESLHHQILDAQKTQELNNA